jgi:hypothetical protein
MVVLEVVVLEIEQAKRRSRMQLMHRQYLRVQLAATAAPRPGETEAKTLIR